MSTTVPDRVSWLTDRFTGLPLFIRRVHRIVAILWILSFAVSLVVDTEQLPSPSIPAITFILLILTGIYLLLRPWVRGSATVSERLNGLRTWSRKPTVIVRRTHRIAAGLFLGFLVLALASDATGGSLTELLLIPIVVLLLYLAITGLSMFLRPWINRFRAS